jgi:hypothetical protein
MVRYAMHGGFTLFGTIHVAILCTVPVLAAALSFAYRRFPATGNFIRLGFAALLLVDIAVCYGWQIRCHNLTFPDHTPFELCDASMALTVFSLILLRPLPFDLAYYWALAGALMALLTPNLLEPFPSFGTVQFFISHGLTVAGVLYLVSGVVEAGQPAALVGGACHDRNQCLCRPGGPVRLLVQDQVLLSSLQACQSIAAGLSWPLAHLHCRHRNCGSRTPLINV